MFESFKPPSVWKVIPMKKRAYRSVSVQSVKAECFLDEFQRFGGSVGIDVGKESFLVSLRYGNDRFEQPWKVKSIQEMPVLVRVLQALHAIKPLLIGMESTGTYGDALRQALTAAGLDVRRVNNKASSDYAEVFDGVNSQHDGKDAAVIAELVSIGKSQPWRWEAPSQADEELCQSVEWLDIHQRQEMQWLGRIEAQLARHWPEATHWLALGSATLLRILAQYGGPAALAADPRATWQLKRWGGSRLSDETIAGLLASAEETVGVQMSSLASEQLKKYALEAQRNRGEQALTKKTLERLAAADPVLKAQAEVVGVNTACVMQAALGDVRDYNSGPAYRKAMGLNLKERSSGKYQGQLRITKRGPARVRRWLYLAALRECQKPGVKEWFEDKKQRENGRAGKALVAIMRKLALALYQVGARGAKYESHKLFPGKPAARLQPPRTANG